MLGGHLYRYFALPYDSPTIGLFFFADDYVKFVSNLKYYIGTELNFIKLEESRYCDKLKSLGGKNIKCPIGVIDDIEIIFLHYQTPEEAKMKWNRRKKRIHWDKLYLKMSESNMCNLEHLKAFDKLLYNNKFMFVSKDYGLNNQIVCSE